MYAYLGRRLLNYAIMLFIATSLGYLLASVSMDPRQLWDFANNPKLNRAAVMANLTEYNINPETPVLTRYLNWLAGVFGHWDWGRSPHGVPVNGEIGMRMLISINFIFLGSFLGMVGGVALGAWNASRQYRLSDRICTLFTLFIISTPVMVLIIFVQMGAVAINDLTGVQIFDFVGPHSVEIPDYFGAYFLDSLKHLVLPTFTLSLAGIAGYSRYQRNLMLDTLGADYVRTARAKGLVKRKAVFKHALRTSLVPMATFFAFAVAGLFLGAAITERLYMWHGLGIFSVESIQGKDINSTAAVVAFSGATTLTGALLSDIFTVLVDPRVRIS